MKLNKLSVAEFKKAIKRQGILGMVAVLAIVLSICALIYSPKPKDDYRINIAKDNTAIMLGEFQDNPLYKQYYDNALESQIQKINFYLTYNVNQPAVLASRVEEIKFTILQLGQIVDDPVFDRVAAKDCATTLRAQLVAYNDLMTEYFNPERIATYANTQQTTLAKELVISVVDAIPASLSEFTIKTWYVGLRTTLRNKNLHSSLIYFINSLTPIPYNLENLNAILETITTFQTTWQSEITEEITNFMVENPASNHFDVKSLLNGLFTNYASAMRSAISYATVALRIQLAGTKSDNELQKLTTFETYNSYVENTQLKKSEFYLNNKFYSTNAQDTVPFNVSSSFEINAFDFAFFASEIASVVILIFSVFFISGMVAGEQSGGTMKMLAIRPFSRRKILRGKLRATMGITVLSLVISFTVALMIGFYFYGISFTPFLAVFNANTALLVSPLLLSIIFIAGLSLKIMVFVAIALLLSVLFRSTAGAVIISFVSYIVVLILNTTLHAFPIYTYFPFANLDLFKYFGGGAVGLGEGGSLISIFSTPILNNSNFYLSLGMTVGLIVVVTYFSLREFVKRDIT